MITNLNTKLSKVENLWKNQWANVTLAFTLSIFFLTVTIALYHPIIIHGNQYDDSYITYRYAINLAEGKGLTFNTYERINSASSLLYTFCLAVFYYVGFENLEFVAVIIGLASGTMLIYLLVLFVSHLSQNRWITIAFTFPLCLCGSIGGWAVSGMETILYALIIMTFLWSYATNRTMPSVISLSLCLLCRPESILLLCAVIGSEIITSGFCISKRLIVFLVIGSTVVAGYWLFNFWYYGNAIPHPVALKQITTYYSPGVVAKSSKVVTFFIRNFSVYFFAGSFWSLAVLLLAFVQFCRMIQNKGYNLLKPIILRGESKVKKIFSCQENRQGSAIDFLLAIFILLSFVSFALGPKSDQRRYTVHIIPLLAISTATYWNKINTFIASHRSRICLLIFAAIVASGQALQNQHRTHRKLFKGIEYQKARKNLGLWIYKNVPKDELVISSDIGAIAYFAKNHDFIDALGLTTRLPLIAAQENSWEQFTKWLQKRQPKWVADTAGGSINEISALRIIDYPWEYYKVLRMQDKPCLNMNSRIKRPAKLKIPIESHSLIIAELDWSGS